MVKILITDDNSNKVKHLRAVLDRIPEIERYDLASDVISAKKFLSKSHYDLLILDLSLPLRMGDDAKPENGLNFLNEINKGTRLEKPFHIIGLTAYEDFKVQFAAHFNEDLWALIKYDETTTHWERQITNKVEYLIQSKKSLQVKDQNDHLFDIAIITALREPELSSVLDLDMNWQAFKEFNDSTEYFKGTFQKEGEVRLKAVAASAPQMGMVASAVLASKMISAFRPKYLIMCGIAAGVRGSGNPGDILIADISFDSGSGKIKTEEDGTAKFLPDYKSLDLHVDLQEPLLSCKAKRTFLDDITRQWKGEKPDTQLNIRIGPLASGAGVIENSKIIEEIKGHSRKLIGIDMETYGIFYAAKHCTKPRPLAAFSIKSLSDYADPLKDDKYQKYAAYTSASFMFKFVTELLEG
jgi:nucleoside phosphorylase